MDRFKASSVRMFLFGFICTVIALLLAAWCLYRQPLQNATASQLDAIHGIGYETALQIEKYVDNNPNCKVEDLDSLPWVGEKKIAEIRKVFK